MADILIASNDRRQAADALAALAPGLDADGDGVLSGPLTRSFADEGFRAHLYPYDELVERFAARCSLLQRTDALVLLSLRPYGKSADLLERLRGVREIAPTLQSMPGVRARAAPVVLSDIKHAMAGRGFPAVDDPWVRVIGPGPMPGEADLEQMMNSMLERTFAETAKLIFEWRTALAEEFEAAGFVIERDEAHRMRVLPVLRRKRRASRLLLDHAHPLALLRFGVPLAALDLDESVAPYRALERLLDDFQRVARADATQQELVFQRFFEANPGLLLGDDYDRLWSQTHFAIPSAGRRSIRPDFLLQPIRVRSATNVLRDWRITELKRPDAPLRSRTGGLSRAVLRAIDQVRTYSDELSKPEHAAEVQRRAPGMSPRTTKAVFVGRRRSSEDREELDQLRAERGVLDVELVIYDELVDTGVRLLGGERRLLGDAGA